VHEESSQRKRAGIARTSVRVVLMRGGTSKGVFVREEDLPPAGTQRDSFILELMGSPDPMQIDGLGGSHSSTSKLMAISASDDPDCDVDYLFAQVGIVEPVVDYSGNCGNLTAAVAAYSIDESLVEVIEPATTVRLRNVNTGIRVVATVPVQHGRAKTHGDQLIAGVPSPGARIVNEYLEPSGSVFGKLLPTGAIRETVQVRGEEIEVSLIDVGHPVAFVRCADMRLDGTESPASLNGRDDFLEFLEALRSACVERLAPLPRRNHADRGVLTVPRLVLLSGGPSLRAISVSLGRIHHAIPVTSAICTAAAACIEGTIPHQIAPSTGHEPIHIAHPKGELELTVSLDLECESPIRSVSLIRTARRLLDGYAYLRNAHELGRGP
jgi:2-methylaconitate isomerase